MRILALDPAEHRVGWALGFSGKAKPEIGVFKLRQKDERIEEAIPRLALWLEKLLIGGADTGAIDLVAVEAYIPHGALKGRTSSDTRDAAVLMHGAIRAVCGLQETAVRAPAVQTIRKHFCGNGFADKEMVVKTAQVLGYIAKDCYDTDMADAVALYDFACSHFANRAASFALT
jgi:Holliday junction resolvasome RuvABC endonuclease subunit